MGMELYRKGCKPHPFQENISLCALSVTHLRERLKEEILRLIGQASSWHANYTWANHGGRNFMLKPVSQSYGIVCNLSLPFVLFWHSRGSQSTISCCLKNPKTRFFLLLIHGRSSSRTLCSLLLRSIGVCWSLKLFLWCRNVQGLFLTPHCLHTFTLVFVHTMSLIEKYFFEIG